jgi:hypothetical protein
MKKKLTEEEVESIFDEEHSDYKLVKDIGFTDEGKYSFGTKIFRDADGTCWKVSASRSGSYFTDYEYQYDSEIVEVEEKEVTIRKWMPVED